MNLTFNPLDPREVADVFNLLRILGAIDAGVTVEVNGSPTMTEAEARRAQADVWRRAALYRSDRVRQEPVTSSIPIDIGDL